MKSNQIEFIIDECVWHTVECLIKEELVYEPDVRLHNIWFELG